MDPRPELTEEQGTTLSFSLSYLVLVADPNPDYSVVSEVAFEASIVPA